MTSSRPRPRLLAALGALAGILLLLVGAPASAHDELLSSDPADGAVLDALPSAITLTFSGVLLSGDGATEIVVRDAAGTDLASGEPVLDGVRVTQALTGSSSGTIEVIWRVVSSDGHPISDEFAFVVGDASQTPTTTATAEPGDDPAGGELRIVWIVLGIVAVGLGGALVALLVAKSRTPRED